MDNNLYSQHDFSPFTFTDDNDNVQTLTSNDLPKRFRPCDLVILFQNRFDVSRETARQLKINFLEHIYKKV